eukprot:scaffold77298_cov63-Phaeocystis_antarctica.AAC.7
MEPAAGGVCRSALPRWEVGVGTPGAGRLECGCQPASKQAGRPSRPASHGVYGSMRGGIPAEREEQELRQLLCVATHHQPQAAPIVRDVELEARRRRRRRRRRERLQQREAPQLTPRLLPGASRRGTRRLHLQWGREAQAQAGALGQAGAARCASPSPGAHLQHGAREGALAVAASVVARRDALDLGQRLLAARDGQLAHSHAARQLHDAHPALGTGTVTALYAAAARTGRAEAVAALLHLRPRVGGEARRHPHVGRRRGELFGAQLGTQQLGAQLERRQACNRAATCLAERRGQRRRGGEWVDAERCKVTRPQRHHGAAARQLRRHRINGGREHARLTHKGARPLHRQLGRRLVLQVVRQLHRRGCARGPPPRRLAQRRRLCRGRGRQPARREPLDRSDPQCRRLAPSALGALGQSDLELPDRPAVGACDGAREDHGLHLDLEWREAARAQRLGERVGVGRAERAEQRAPPLPLQRERAAAHPAEVGKGARRLQLCLRDGQGLARALPRLDASHHRRKRRRQHRRACDLPIGEGGGGECGAHNVARLVEGQRRDHRHRRGAWAVPRGTEDADPLRELRQPRLAGVVVALLGTQRGPVAAAEPSPRRGGGGARLEGTQLDQGARGRFGRLAQLVVHPAHLLLHHGQRERRAREERTEAPAPLAHVVACRLLGRALGRGRGLAAPHVAADLETAVKGRRPLAREAVDLRGRQGGALRAALGAGGRAGSAASGVGAAASHRPRVRPPSW